MCKVTSLVCAAGMLGLSMVSAGAQTVGDWVLGNYENAGYWFPGVISKVWGDQITIQYDDGDVETVPSELVRPYNWAIGHKVECNWKGQGDWYAATISSLAGEKIGIAYEDGDRETTTTGMCRSK